MTSVGWFFVGMTIGLFIGALGTKFGIFLP